MTLESGSGAIREAAEAFLGDEGYEAEEGQSGMNNTTRRIRYGGKRYMLRIYNTHRDPEKARFEHLVLRKLAEHVPPLSFRVPVPLAARTGETVVWVGAMEGTEGTEEGMDGKGGAEGRLAACFRYIEGRRPDLENRFEAEVFGAAVGELLGAMSGVEKGLGQDLTPQYPPYYELGSAHPRCSLPEVARFCACPPELFAGERENLRFLADEVERINGKLDGLRSLPHQLIHGDLNATNALVREDGAPAMAALLDFEFATVDLRAMEPAVCLWGLVPAGKPSDGMEESAWEGLRAFWRGFRSQAALEPAELEAIPLLMQLRSLDVFLHFLGRYLDGVDGSGVLAGQIPDTAARMRFVTRHGERLEALLRSY